MSKFYSFPRSYFVKNSKKIVTKITIIFLVICFVAVAANAVVSESKKRKNSQLYTAEITKYAEQFSLNESLVYAVIHCESSFDCEAVSAAGASGLMQIMPSTFEWICTKIGIENPNIFDPSTNILVGCWYLSYLFEKFGEVETVLAAYNAGEGTVSEWLQDEKLSSDGKKLKKIPYTETKYYVFSVIKAQKTYEK